MSNIKYIILICCLAYLSILNCQTTPIVAMKSNHDSCHRNEECVSKHCLTCIRHCLRDSCLDHRF